MGAEASDVVVAERVAPVAGPRRPADGHQEPHRGRPVLRTCTTPSLMGDPISVMRSLYDMGRRRPDDNRPNGPCWAWLDEHPQDRLRRRSVTHLRRDPGVTRGRNWNRSSTSTSPHSTSNWRVRIDDCRPVTNEDARFRRGRPARSGAGTGGGGDPCRGLRCAAAPISKLNRSRRPAMVMGHETGRRGHRGRIGGRRIGSTG